MRPCGAMSAARERCSDHEMEGAALGPAGRFGGADGRLNAVVGSLLALGGAFAFLRKGSVPSLVGGVGCGGALLGSAALVGRNPRRAFSLGALVSSVLTVVMLLRALKMRKMMPAGLVTMLGTLALVANASQLSR
mmetsp:Transcript_83444/g.231595  ORF Transcript_83444/g.231595 Transcript_83444/m.231595 type:complete len:135 (-) Transcript_83444:127-531(-)|eukprot:CAMPEP_0179087424 /NCGR_PEP_ID=MMETSP0796-20121207/39719_1 /TAXON_ID=73915 /ORGANISM="Pyrodinium bahamense, Strain pbaha01" /LENGTH=134 /DNA_ID=CAMNT_0020784927 /DNA_START=22 /DNA_END=426 /DNA_ORIENTATION=-